MNLVKDNWTKDDIKPFLDYLNQFQGVSYPNPTQGNLKVSISGLENSDKCHLDVYSIQGTQILAFDVNSDNANVDISNQPNGVYMLQITINGKSTTWKIIKK